MNIPEIKQNLSIDTVLKHYGFTPDKNQRLNCPWHKDKTPSLQIYPKTGTWMCFSSNCDAGNGDVIDFIMKFENISKYEAIQKSIALIGNAPVEKTKNETPKPPQKTLLERIEAVQNAFNYFRNGIRTSGKQLNSFLEDRGLNKGVLEIGYNSGQIHHRAHKAYIDSYLDIGLLNENKSGGYRVFAKFCVIFALKNESGQVVSFYGRSIYNNDKAKHYYLRNTQGLYPAYPVVSTRKLILPECIIDTASLLQCPRIKNEYNLLSAYGTNRLTKEHIEAIRKLKNLEEIIFFFDGDDAGRKAVLKYAQELHLLFPNLTITTVNTPEDEDVNSLYTTYDEDCLVTLISERKAIYEPAKKEHVSITPAQSLDAPTFNAANHEALTYETSDFHITVLGGIKISGLERMKVTLKLAVKSSHYAPLRQHLDLYNNDQLTRFVRTVNEQLDVKTELIRSTLLTLIEELEHYRIERISSMQTVQEESPALTRKELTEAEVYLKDQDLMKNTMQDLGKTGIVGEVSNRLIMFLVFLSRITHEPLHIISFGASGTGKTHLQEGISKLLPKEDKVEITAMSGNSLYYFKNEEIQNKVLLIEDMDGAQEVLYPLRELQTKRKITKRVSIKNSQGNIKTVQITVEGPVCIAGCTTKSRIYEDNANRSILIYIDSSTAQDERIMDYQRAESAGKINKEEERHYQNLLCNVQRTLKPVKVVNPFAPKLKIPSRVFKKRRSNWIYLRFIEIVTLYQQYQREEKVDTTTGESFIETTLEDIAWANKLLKGVLLQKADELSDPTRRFLERLKSWLIENKKEQFKTSDIRNHLNVTASSIKRYLPELLNCGHVKIIAGNKSRGYTYEITSYEEYKTLRFSIDNVLDRLLEELKEEEIAC